MSDNRKHVIVAVLYGFGAALALGGFCVIIAAAIRFTWPKMLGAVCTFGAGLTMILTGGYMDDEDEHP